MIGKPGVRIESSEQVRERLLCSACDNVRIGTVENRISRLVYQTDRRAPLLDLLGNVLMSAPDGARAALPGRLNADDLVYFGVSVFWRASISSVLDFQLGAEHDEAFRQFLLGAEFPAAATCTACFYDLPLETGEHIASICYFPWTAEAETYSVHEFLVFGLGFALVTGAVPDNIRAFCTKPSAQQWITLARQDVLLDSAFATFIKTSRRVGGIGGAP